jgi:3-methyl-2-oxobutanoate hydroxymethyltransferase
MTTPTPFTVPQVAASKRRNGAAPLTMITAYDEPSARFVDAAGAELLLVGDSVGNVVLGQRDTLGVTVEMMAHHVAAVARANPKGVIVGDLPWMSYHVSVEDSVRNAAALVRAGAHCVKLEGGKNRVDVISAITNAEIPVMGHLGLTPQSVLAMGGFKVQGKTEDAAQQLMDDALAIERAGAFAVVLEGIPDVVATRLTEALTIPTIGIGAGPDTDGQVLVFHDLLGLGNRTPPKFVRVYAQIGQAIEAALTEFVADVRGGAFPSDAETYHAPKGSNLG